MVELISLVLDGAAFLALGVLGSSLIAQRSLHDHVAEVAAGLAIDLEHGPSGHRPHCRARSAIPRRVRRWRARRSKVSRRISRTASWRRLSTWLVGGLPGGCRLQDHQHGRQHDRPSQPPRYEAYGWAAARLDDLVNLPASRLAALLIVLAAALLPGCSAMDIGQEPSGAMRATIAHPMPVGRRPRWREPWDCDLAGPRTYDGVVGRRWLDGHGDAPMRRPPISWRRFGSIVLPARFRRV